MKNYLGKKLREARAAKGWSLARLGEETGIHKSVLSRYELGERAPNFDSLDLLANALGVKLGDLRSLQHTEGDEGIGFSPKNLKRLLTDRRLPKSHFARLVGVTPGSIYHWLAGRVVPSNESILAMCQALNCHPADLCSGNIEELQAFTLRSVSVDQVAPPVNEPDDHEKGRIIGEISAKKIMPLLKLMLKHADVLTDSERSLLHSVVIDVLDGIKGDEIILTLLGSDDAGGEHDTDEEVVHPPPFPTTDHVTRLRDMLDTSKK